MRNIASTRFGLTAGNSSAQPISAATLRVCLAGRDLLHFSLYPSFFAWAKSSSALPWLPFFSYAKPRQRYARASFGFSRIACGAVANRLVVFALHLVGHAPAVIAGILRVRAGWPRCSRLAAFVVFALVLSTIMPTVAYTPGRTSGRAGWPR